MDCAYGYNDHCTIQLYCKDRLAAGKKVSESSLLRAVDGERVEELDLHPGASVGALEGLQRREPGGDIPVACTPLGELRFRPSSTRTHPWTD